MTNAAQYGLIARGHLTGEAIALEGVRVTARVSGPSVEVTVTQRYHNREQVPIETVYVFPLDEAAAVCGFSARIGDTLVRGEIEERERAFERYDDASMDGDAAFLLEQERPNVFTASVGSLLPGERVQLELRYVARLSREGDALRLTIPTTVSPRYVPRTAPEIGQPAAERVNPETRDEVPYGLTLGIEVADALRRLESPSHPIRTTQLAEAQRIELSQEQVALDRDFVLLLTPREEGARVQVAREPDGRRVALLSFRHALTASQERGYELIFLLDCSGSMEGASLTQAKRALALCIRALAGTDSFNVICFGGRYKTLFPSSRPFTDESLSEATRWLESVEANLGGTEILAPLEHALASAADPARPRRVLLLTDGQVANEADVIALARRHVHSARVFTFGIGAGASAYLVRGVARASRAACELIFPGERIEPKVLRLFERVRTPALDDVSIDWGGMSVEQAPSQLPPLFAGDDLTVFARVLSGTAGELTLRAGTHESTLSVDFERAELGGPIPTLWARERIRELEESSEDSRDPEQQRRLRELRRAELVELGRRYGLLSSATSFVAVQVRSPSERSPGPAEQRRIPIAITSGQARPPSSPPVVLGGMIPLPTTRSARPFTPMMSAAAPDDATWEPSRAELPPAALLRRAIGFFTGGRAEQEASSLDPLYELLMTQHADGRFTRSAPLARWLGARVARLEQVLGNVDEALVVTSLVVLLLAQEADRRRAEWRPAVHKARAWLSAQPTTFDAAPLLSAP